jgi:hypothetical protein
MRAHEALLLCSQDDCRAVTSVRDGKWRDVRRSNVGALIVDRGGFVANRAANRRPDETLPRDRHELTCVVFPSPVVRDMDLRRRLPVVFKVSTWRPTDSPACSKSTPFGQVELALLAEGIYAGSLELSVVYPLMRLPSKLTE